jgi:hypothetical protein
MRTLLALVLLGLAGYLIWHGFNTADAARAELQKQTKPGAVPDFGKIHASYPYSDAAIDARAKVFDSEITKKRDGGNAAKTPGSAELKTVGLALADRTKKGISTEQPFVQPDAAAIIGVAGLLLALVLPRTRFRGLAFLGFLIGGLATLAALLPIDSQVGLVNKFGPIKYVINNFPRVAQACLALAGITLAARVSGVPRKPQ